jgi:uncharacterized membrane protein YjjP (DUF1212 family)
MDKIQRKSPIKQRQVKQPVVLAFNMLLNHYLAYKTQPYKVVQNIIMKQNRGMNLKLLPNVTNISMTIEHRAASFAKLLRQLSIDNGD